MKGIIPYLLVIVGGLLLIALFFSTPASIVGGGCVQRGVGSEYNVIDRPLNLDVSVCGPFYSPVSLSFPSRINDRIDFVQSCNVAYGSGGIYPALLVRDWTKSPEGSLRPIWYQAAGISVTSITGSQYFSPAGKVEVMAGALICRDCANVNLVCNLQSVTVESITTTTTTTTTAPSRTIGILPIFKAPQPSATTTIPATVDSRNRIPILSDIIDAIGSIIGGIISFIAIPLLPP